MLLLPSSIKDQVTTIWSKYFVGGTVQVTVGKLTGAVFVRFYLANDSSEVHNGIMGNDTIQCLVSFEDTGNAVVLEYSLFNISNLKADNVHLAMHNQKVTTRKYTGSLEKAMASLDRNLGKLADTIKTLVSDDQFLPLPYNPLDKIV